MRERGIRNGYSLVDPAGSGFGRGKKRKRLKRGSFPRGAIIIALDAEWPIEE